MAKPSVPTPEFLKGPCRYLFHLRGTSRPGVQSRVRLHMHPYWQVEEILKGAATLVTPSQQQVLPCGVLVFIPPFVSHGFIYSGNETGFLSCKFSVSGPEVHFPIVVSENTAPEQALKNAVETLLPESGEPSRKARLALENVCLALLALNYNWPHWTDRKKTKSDLCGRIENFVWKHTWHSLSVEEVTAHLGYSINYVNARLKAEKSMSLKQYLDRQRAEMASHMLRDSKLNISEIALTLRFPDIYSFSRFFKRVTGKNPSAFRREI